MDNTAVLLETFFKSLTDDQLLYLYGIYLGEVPTPFHKKLLIDELVRFFSLPQTADAMASLLDNEDMEIITLVHHLNMTDSRRLHEILSLRGWGWMQLSRKLMNLSERLVIIAVRGNYVLHPLITDRVSLVLDQLYQRHSPIAEPCWFTPSLLTAWLFLAEHHRRLFTTQGKLKIQFSETVKRMIPDRITVDQLNLLARTADHLGLIATGTRELSLNHDRITSLFSLGEDQVLLYGLASLMNRSDSDPRKLSALLQFCREHSFYRQDMIALMMIHFGCTLEEAEQTLDFCSESAIISCSGDTYSFGAVLDMLLQPPGPDPECTLSADLRIHVDGAETSIRWFQLYRCAQLVTFDRMAILRLTEESVLTCLDEGMGLEEMIRLIEEITGTKMQESTSKIISNWVEGYHALKLFEGVVLQCDQRLSRMITGHPGLSEMVQDQLAPGIFLVSPRNLDLLRSTLTKAGVPFIPRVIRTKSAEPQGKADEFHRIEYPMFAHVEHPSHEVPSTRITDDLKSLLKHYSREVQLELSYRIDQRLMLSAEQLRRSSKRRTIFEAKGFDYQGKLQLIRQAIKSPSDILELSLRGKEQEPILVKPTELFREKTGDILEGIIIPEDTKVNLAVGKLFMVRKIRRPLYLQ